MPGTRKLTVEVEEELLAEAKTLAFRAGVSMTEVVRRLLALYVEGKIVVRKKESDVDRAGHPGG